MKTTKRQTKIQQPKKEYDDKYIEGLVTYLHLTLRQKVGAEEDDYYMGYINAYSEIIQHINKTYKY